LTGYRIFHTLDQTTTTVQVTHHVTHVVLGSHHFYLHDRLKHLAAALLGQLLGRHGGRDLERHLVGVDVVVGTIEHGRLQADQRIAGDNAVLHLLFDTLLDRRDVFLRNYPPDNFVGKHQTFGDVALLVHVRSREANPAMTELTTTTRLTNELAFNLDVVLGDGFTVGNLRLTDVRIDVEL